MQGDNEAGGAHQLKRVMDRVMYFATREKEKGVTEAATAVYGMLLRSLIASAGGPVVILAVSSGTEAAEASPDASTAAVSARKAVDGCIHEVFDKRKTRWGYGTLSNFLKRAPDSLPELLLPQLLDKARAARSEFLQIEALKLCNMCMRYGCCCLSERPVVSDMVL